MFSKAKATVVVGAVGLGTAFAAAATPAVADPQTRPTDALVVGSDTAQYAGDFLADGDVAGDPGYNQGKANHVFNVFATGDGNGRALYGPAGCVSGECGTNGQLYGQGTTSLVLKAGTKPVKRPDGSGDGYAALIADSIGGTGYNGLPAGSINFTRASRLPKASEQSQCAAITDCGGLHVFQFATDTLQVAAFSGTGGTHAFPLSLAQLTAIYNCTATTWATVPNAPSGASTNTIYAVIPQSGSGTRNFFLADLGLSAPGSCVHTSQEHDPTGITLAPSPADAIEPFSTGKLALIHNGYFANSGEPASDFTIQELTGTASDGSPAYSSSRGIYLIARDFDLGLVPGTAPCTGTGQPNACKSSQPGGLKNWVNDFLVGSTSWTARSSGQTLISAAGFTPAYQDLGDVSSG